MNLYRISQTANRDYGTYDSMIVYAETEEEARHIRPDHCSWAEGGTLWCRSPDQVIVELIGTALPGLQIPWQPRGVVLASFNAG